jgi:hypothetical protein
MSSIFAMSCAIACADKPAEHPPATSRQPSAAVEPLRTGAPFRWRSSPPLVGPLADATHPIVSIKDPSIVYFAERWHLFATTASESGAWSLVYLSFRDWAEAATAKQHHLGDLPALTGYHAAPQIFFFAPHQKWYLVFQSGQPQYSTTDDLSKPESWSKPQDFFPAEPASVRANKGAGGWLDFWNICDAAACYLFFTDDNGSFYRSRTSISAFPQGFAEPVVVMRASKEELYEASATYLVQETKQYLTLIEAIGPEGRRYFRSFVAAALDDEWKPLAATWEHPFAGANNVEFEDGKPWTRDISHGELLRSGHDQTLSVSLNSLRFLYQGVAPEQSQQEYFRIPYRLGLLTRVD